MHLIQFATPGSQRRVGLVDGDRVATVNTVASVRELTLGAIRGGHGLTEEIDRLGIAGDIESLRALLDAARVLPPLDHEDNHRCLVSGTGLTHTGSAATRDSMHGGDKAAEAEADLSDSMKIFRWGLDSGRPASGQSGVQPEWFYKGDGGIIVRPGGALPAPVFGEDFGEEPEIAGLYVIGDDRIPYRVGYAIANETSDHVMERRNYLYLAHSKLRHCAFGPVLLTGELPQAIDGSSRIWRDGELHWEKPFLSGEAHMCHSLENLEYHHFKYSQFLSPGDVHIHFFGTATLSFADQVRTRPGDVFEIACPLFGPSLRNTIAEAAAPLPPGGVRAL